ncbi:NACHT, LRR and PYD domains-containing protein 14 [Holothuria leucospilota]|uniref:NACHT, LRR and PYD domains-containing protein 14 n=1 Tax=Holothuria leucospilota TaxID=206669 RepID=A0A9Q1CPE0_HOLLE|nr:NACHT, LRR and PYD domains-containing protein 14 [Holothuria leucospilota]
MYILRFLVVGALMTSSSFGENHDHCELTQYLERGKSGVIECRFQEGFYVVAWYTPEGFEQKKPLLRLVNGVKKDEDFASGEYDVRRDGSLIINNVTLHHDHTFIAVKFQSQGDEEMTLTVRVIVLVKPSTMFPVVDVCRDGSTSCYTTLNTDSVVTCYVADSRPAISLKWASRTFGHEMNISSQYAVEQDGSLFISRAATSDAFAHSSLLSLIVCEADNQVPMLSHDESIVFVENESSGLASETPILTYVERNARLDLPCSETNVSLIVWKKADLGGDDFYLLMYSALFDGSISRIYSEEYELQSNGTLTLSRIQAKHEGLYGCIFETFGNTGGATLYHVTVFVPSSPSVDGCMKQQYCVLNVETEGILKCSVTGIRPRVHLEWATNNMKDSHLIHFYDHQLTSNSVGDVYDVVLTSRYRIEPKTRDILTLECRITGTNVTKIQQVAQVDLRINSVLPTADSETPATLHFIWLLVLIIPVGLIAVLLAYVFIRKGQLRRNDTRERFRAQYQEERLPMFKSTSIQRKQISAKKNQLISQLKTKYQDLYDAVQPIPYIRDRLFCVDKVFVEGGIEYLIANNRIGGHDTWAKLSTYHDICNDPRVKSSRRIIEGEPGYGKSTLSLQLAYDWCNKISASSMKNTDILILLQLRQLGGVNSIYKAIKQFLLPKDSKLGESDIEDIMSESSSVVIILDGFDEYPDQDKKDTDVINIIARKMFQQFDVILTTRSSCLPEDYSAITKRIKLTGFDDNARDLYIRKAVVGDDNAAASKIKQKLKDNPILGDLCQVPLLFVMFAHMSHENEKFQKFNSVTSFFRYMISCFHSHLKNKTKGENVKLKAYEFLEQDHKELDKLAFEGLSDKHQQIVWKKEDICKRLGQEFYNHYVRLGILVEGEVLDLGNDQNAIISEHIQYKTEVRFYHKLFCEWYAAHHLSDYASREDVTLKSWDTTDENELSTTNKTTFSKERPHHEQETNERKEGENLKYVDPLDVQYLYRFACGLNSKAADKIIAYFRERDDASKFVILCMLEQGRTGEEALRDVGDLCSRDVYIYRGDSLLLQRSTIQLLEIASINEIGISRLWFADCFGKVDSSTGSIQLTSNLCVPVLNSLRELVIEERGREITVEEMAGILKYPVMSQKLQELRFYDCLLPQTVKGEHLSLLRSKGVQVFWRPDHQFVLNLTSGSWEDEDEREPMTTEQYQKEADKVRRYRNGEAGR